MAVKTITFNVTLEIKVDIDPDEIGKMNPTMPFAESSAYWVAKGTVDHMIVSARYRGHGNPRVTEISPLVKVED